MQGTAGTEMVNESCWKTLPLNISNWKAGEMDPLSSEPSDTRGRVGRGMCERDWCMARQSELMWQQSVERREQANHPPPKLKMWLIDPKSRWRPPSWVTLPILQAPVLCHIVANSFPSSSSLQNKHQTELCYQLLPR